VDFETIVRRAGGFDRAQPDEAPDAVVDVDDEIAGGEAGHLGEVTAGEQAGERDVEQIAGAIDPIISFVRAGLIPQAKYASWVRTRSVPRRSSSTACHR
jgi:hypothetical protein